MNMIMDNSAAHHLQQGAPLATHQHQQTAAMPSPQRSGDLLISTVSSQSSSSSSPGLLSPMGHTKSNNNNGNMRNNNNNLSPKSTINNNNTNQMAPSATTTTTTTTPGSKATLKRSFDVAFLMMPDERIKQKQQQAEKHARLCEAIEQAHQQHNHNHHQLNHNHQQQQQVPQYPTDLSPRAHGPPAQPAAHLHMQHHMQHLQQLHAHDQAFELFNLHQQQQQHSPPDSNGRRYPQITIRSPRIYDDPSLVIPLVDSLASVSASSGEPLPMKSAFTKVISASSGTSSTARRLDSPLQPGPPLSPDQLSCPSMSPPVATTPPRTNSGNGSLSNGSSNSTPNPSGGGGGSSGGPAPGPPSLNPSIVYQSFRPEYQFNGAFQTVSHVQALQAQRLKQQLLYRPPGGGGGNNGGGAPNGPQGNQPPTPPAGDFIAGYAGFPFPPGGPPAGHPHPFASVAPPELPRIVQNPAAAAILSTLIPPTLASTFTLTAQNVCAKCNISFRMTSDLVYHMRSHHKSEVACDPNRRKREEKLKCPVCQESFRERHHLTRHMTAHQDKESDQAPPNGPGGNAATASSSSSSAGEPLINVGGGVGGSSAGQNVRNYGSRMAGGAAAAK